jgi:2-isopropylmalate synthase
VLRQEASGAGQHEEEDPMAEDGRVIIFDTTLRDGEQSPGASMNTQEKLEIARALDELGVDVIEAGFPIASPGDFEAVEVVAREVRRPIICALARCNDLDIDRAWEAVRHAARPRLHVFLATSAVHREFKLRMGKAQILERAVEGVRRAKRYCEDVEFSPEDAARTELDFLTAVVQAAIDAGATTINIPDTVGYAVPEQFASIIRHLIQNVRGADRVIFSVHCHNDLGLAVANSLASVKAGARQVECTINGIGERAGNAALEEVVMALKVRRDYFGVTTNIRTERLYPTSRLVSNITGLLVQRNKAVVGRNAFAHEAGIHQDGILKERSTYEIMRPEDVGVPRSELVLGKHSGRHALKKRLLELGYHPTEEQLDRVFEDFKRLADKKKEIYDADLEALMEGHMRETVHLWRLSSFHVLAGSSVTPTATVRLAKLDDGEYEDAATGDGPIDAVFRALERITGIVPRLTDFQVRSVTGGKDAQGEVTVEVEYDQQMWRGRGLSTDIVEAAAQAYLTVLNRIAAYLHKSPVAPTLLETGPTP